MKEIQDLWDKGFKKYTLDKMWTVIFGMAVIKKDFKPLLKCKSNSMILINY
jgi:hypothetical protein